VKDCRPTETIDKLFTRTRIARISWTAWTVRAIIQWGFHRTPIIFCQRTMNICEQSRFTDAGFRTRTEWGGQDIRIHIRAPARTDDGSDWEDWRLILGDTIVNRRRTINHVKRLTIENIPSFAAGNGTEDNSSTGGINLVSTKRWRAVSGSNLPLWRHAAVPLLPAVRSPRDETSLRDVHLLVRRQLAIHDTKTPRRWHHSAVYR